MLFSKGAFRKRRLHFIGVGGIGMSGIAEILLNLGYTVSGSDLRASPVTERLRELGAVVQIGHAKEHLGDPEAVVTSSAIPADNPELAEARHRKVPVISRGELLAELMRVKYGVAVAGSHGKTSTASLCAAVLASGALDPTVVIGGRVATMGSNARLGKSDYLLVEADESDGSFLALDPIIGVVTNIDREHMDHYGSIERLMQAFEDFTNNLPFYGAAIVCTDDPLGKRLACRVRRRCLTYGLRADSPDADVVADDIELGRSEATFRLHRAGEDLGIFRVRGVGLHTVRNAMAAMLVGQELEIPLDRIRTGLADFHGVDRRFQERGTAGGVTVIDDYGHHPTEIRTTLAAAAACGYRTVNVIFQPHRYTRTKDLEEEFAECFADCDRLWVVDIYSAGEDPLPGVSSPSLVNRIRRAGQARAAYCSSMQDAVRQALDHTAAGDVLITFGAGNIWMAGEEFLKQAGTRGDDSPGSCAGVGATPSPKEAKQL